MQDDSRHGEDFNADTLDDVASEQLSRYARLLEAAFVQFASPVMGGERLKATLAEARATACPDAADYLGSVRATVDRWSCLSPILAMSSGRRQAIPLWDILYFTRVDDEPFVQTDHGRYHCAISLDKAEALLDARGFVRAHRSYLINISRTSSIDVLKDGSGIILFGGADATAKVSRRKMREILEAFGSWRREVVPPWVASCTRGR